MTEIVTINPETTISKTLPWFEGIAAKVAETYGPEMVQDICGAAAAHFSSPYLDWETVRKKRTKRGTGFEGYLTIFPGTPEDRYEILGGVALAALDTDVRQYPYQPGRRAVAENLIQHTSNLSPNSLRPAIAIFRSMRDSLITAVHSSHQGSLEEYNRFRDETRDATRSLDPLSISYVDGHLVHAYNLPDRIGTLGWPEIDVTKYPKNMQIPLLLAKEIGVIGHPLVRIIELNGPLWQMLTQQWQFYPPRGSSKRQLLDDMRGAAIIASLQRLR